MTRLSLNDESTLEGCELQAYRKIAWEGLKLICNWDLPGPKGEWKSKNHKNASWDHLNIRMLLDPINDVEKMLFLSVLSELEFENEAPSQALTDSGLKGFRLRDRGHHA
jgi:hypothetical protein